MGHLVHEYAAKVYITNVCRFSVFLEGQPAETNRACTPICLSEDIFRAVPTMDTDTSLFLFITFFLNTFIFLLYFCDSLRVVYPDIKPIF